MIETKTLQELEAVIERGLETYVEVGNALRDIRDARLYRELGYPTFEDYCEQRWGMARRTAYDYTKAAEVAENVCSSTQNVPSLTQARELAVLQPEQQREIAANTDFSQTTVKELKEKVEEIRNPQSVHFSSESAEWYTPPEIIERVLAVMGSIDVDPCANPGAPNFEALARYTKQDDGLKQAWRGKVYMNPPYGDVIGEWVEKLCTEYALGIADEAIALVPARVDTQWFKKLRDFPRCFIEGRLKFSNAENSAPFPSAVVYLGKDYDKFYSAFSDLGDIWIRIRGKGQSS